MTIIDRFQYPKLFTVDVIVAIRTTVYKTTFKTQKNRKKTTFSHASVTVQGNNLLSIIAVSGFRFSKKTLLFQEGPQIGAIVPNSARKKVATG